LSSISRRSLNVVDAQGTLRFALVRAISNA
jgi:hypothetical protein